MEYIYTVKTDSGTVKFESNGHIIEGEDVYRKMDEWQRKYIGPYIEILMRGLDKCAIDSFTVELKPIE